MWYTVDILKWTFWDQGGIPPSKAEYLLVTSIRTKIFVLIFFTVAFLILGVC